MQYASLNEHNFLIKLEPGDDIAGFIGRFCLDHDITNATVQGIGSVDSPTLAHYSKKSKQFQEVSFEGIYEIVSLLGNVSLQGDTRLVHVHVTITDPDMHAFGGHLVHGTCSATAELVLTSYPTKFTKKPNDKIGLSVWDLPSQP